MDVSQEILDKAAESLNGFISLLGIEATYRSLHEDDRIKIYIDSQEAGRIIGRKGKTLGAIQLLLNNVMRKDDEQCPWIQIMIEGYEPRSKRNKDTKDSDDQPKEVLDQEETTEVVQAEENKDTAEPVAVETVIEVKENEPAVEKNESKEDDDKTHHRNNRNRNSRRRHKSRNFQKRKPNAAKHVANSPEDSLNDMKAKAQDAIKEVKRWGEEVRLPPIDSKLQSEIENILRADPEIVYSPRCAAGKTSFVINLG